MGRVGVIVDAHLDALESMNSGSSPILDDFFLPAGIQLLYASSDSGTEPVNRMLKMADRYANDLLWNIERDDLIRLQSARAHVPHADYFRLWKRNRQTARK